MDRKIVAATLACLVSGAVCGCGTVRNVSWFTWEEGGKREYGGVRLDAEQGSKYLGEAFAPAEEQEPPPKYSRPVAFALGAYFLAVDLPLSAVGDTLTLPWAFGAELAHLDEDPARNDGEWERFWGVDRASPPGRVTATAPPRDPLPPEAAVRLRTGGVPSP